MKKKNNFLKGALVLSIGGLLAKVLGALYRIPLTNILGSYGVGLYQLVFPPYILFLTLAQAGVPTALSKLIAESNSLGDKTRAEKQFKFAFWLLLASGFIGAVLMAVFSGAIAQFEGNSQTAKAFVIVAPALLFVPVTNVLKGYFQGNMNMVPSGITTVLEQLVKLVFGLSLASNFMPDVEKAVYGTVFAITISEFSSLVIMSVTYLVHKHKNKTLPVKLTMQDGKEIGSNLLLFAVPVAMGGFVLQLSQVVDSVMVVNLIGTTNATELYGLWTGPVSSMLGLPIALSGGVAVSVLPSITETFVAGNSTELNKSFNNAIKLTLIIALPCALGLMTLSTPILSLLYSSLPVEEIRISAIALSLSGLSVVFLSVLQTCVSVCQAVGKPYSAVIVMSVAIVIKTAINLVLLPIKSVNIYGCAISETMCYLFATVCVIIYLHKKIGLTVDVASTLLPPLASSLVMTLVITLFVCFGKNAMSHKFFTLVLIAIGGVIYFGTLLLTGAVGKTELQTIKNKLNNKQDIKN